MRFPVIDAGTAEKRITLRALLGFFDNTQADGAAEEVDILLMVGRHLVVDV